MVRTYNANVAATDRPFATDNDAPRPVGHNPQMTPYGEERARSNVVLAGPEQVRREDILSEQMAAQQRKPYAGRTNHSEVVLTDEVRWERQPQQRHRSDVGQQNQLSLCQDLPVHAGQRPPEGCYYDDHGNLKVMPSYAAQRAHTNITMSMFGGADGSAAPPVVPAAPGRGRVASNAAQNTVLDAIMYGRKDGSVAAADVGSTVSAAAERALAELEVLRQLDAGATTLSIYG